MADRKGTNTGFLDFARNDGEEHKRVPLFGTWRNAYIVVIIVFVANVVLFYAISRLFA